MTKKVIALALSLALLCGAAALAADSISGDWSGKAKITLLPFTVNTDVSFREDGTFTLSMIGLKASGKYSAGEDTITITPTAFEGLFASQLASPESIGAVKMPLDLEDDTLGMNISLGGVDASIELTRN